MESRDIWSLAAARLQDQPESSEKTLLILGERNSGKSTLVQLFSSASKPEATKPTAALDYSYCRAPLGVSSKRDVGHVYELGGGRLLADLVSVVLRPELLQSTVVVLTLDLSHPHKVVDSMLFWLLKLRERTEACIAELRQQDAKAAAKLEVKQAKQWQTHEDRKTVTPFPLPLVIVANKYDLFQNEESERKKWMARTLRYFAHKNGASLLYCSQNDQRLAAPVSITQYRTVLSHFIFGGLIRKYEQSDHAQAIVMSARADSLQSIGLAPSVRGAVSGTDDQWAKAFQELFPRPAK